MTNDKIPRAHAQELAVLLCHARQGLVRVRAVSSPGETGPWPTTSFRTPSWPPPGNGQRCDAATRPSASAGYAQRSATSRSACSAATRPSATGWPNWKLYTGRRQQTLSAEAASAITLERCWQTIQALPPQQHAIAVMRWLLGMKNNEIAESLGIAEGTVAAHLSTVRGKLRASLGPYDPFSGDEKDD